MDICEAIRDRAVISFHYKGLIRTVEPHLLGYDSDGDQTLSAWQLNGGSGQGWRDFHTAKITELARTGAHFSAARHGYNPNDQSLSQIVCRL